MYQGAVAAEEVDGGCAAVAPNEVESELGLVEVEEHGERAFADGVRVGEGEGSEAGENLGGAVDEDVQVLVGGARLQRQWVAGRPGEDIEIAAGGEGLSGEAFGEVGAAGFKDGIVVGARLAAPGYVVEGDGSVAGEGGGIHLRDGLNNSGASSARRPQVRRGQGDETGDDEDGDEGGCRRNGDAKSAHGFPPVIG